MEYSEEVIDMADAIIRDRGFQIPAPDHLRQCIKIYANRPDYPLALAKFGIPYPFPDGWRSYLIGIWNWEGSVIHDTVFDEPFCAKWLGVRSGRRVPLDNVRPMT